MNSKNYIILTVAVASLLCSCNKSDEYSDTNGDGCLRFNAKIGPNIDDARADNDSRAVYTRDTIFVDSDVYVTADVDNINSNTVATRGVPIESELKIPSLKVQVIKTGGSTWASGLNRQLEYELSMPNTSGGNFDYSPLVTILKDGLNRTFIAFSPLDGTGGVTKKSITELNYTVPADVTQHPDLCTSKMEGNTDIKNTGSNEHIRDFELQHNLTAIGFALRGSGVKIISATITGVKTTGTLTLDKKTWALGSAAEARAAKIKQQFYNVGLTAPWVDCTEANGYLMMIPQTLTDAAKLTVVYQYNYGENRGKNLTLVSNLKKLTGGVWAAGKRITYNIRLKADPAVTAGDLLIDCSLAGFTTESTINMANVANDDVLTFTWDASWLKIHQGSPKENNTSGGATSGWSAAANRPLDNIYFFATNNNPSTYTRTATVTVRGKKSLEQTFRVTQRAKPTLSVSPSSLNVGYERLILWGYLFSITTNSSVEKISLKSDDNSWLWVDWLKPSTFSFYCNAPDWNVNPGKRSTNIRVQLFEKNILANEVVVPVTQHGSGCFVVINDDNRSIRSLVDANDGGDYATGTLDIPSHCGINKTLPSEGLWRIIMEKYVKTGRWINKGNLRSNRWYWTNEYNFGRFDWYGKDVFMDLNNNNNYWFTLDHYESDAKTYRCVTK